MTPRVTLTVDGIDGSGKSTFGRRLLAACQGRGLAAVLIRVDDFRRPVDWSRSDKPEADLYYDEYYDFALLETCLETFLGGAAGFEVPHYDGAQERLGGVMPLDFAEAQVALVEGVFPLRARPLRSGGLVYLATSLAEARRRIITRDRAKGRSLVEVERRIDRRYFPGQERYHAAFDPAGRAQVVVEHEQPGALRVLRLDEAALPHPLGEVVSSLFSTGGPRV